MTKEQVINKLVEGRALCGLLPFEMTGPFYVYKGQFSRRLADDVVYVPGSSLLNPAYDYHEPLSEANLEGLADMLYTSNDLLFLCSGSEKLARDLLSLCGFEAPKTVLQNLYGYMGEELFEKVYGINGSDLKRGSGNAKVILPEELREEIMCVIRRCFYEIDSETADVYLTMKVQVEKSELGDIIPMLESMEVLDCYPKRRQAAVLEIKDIFKKYQVA